MFLSAFSQIYIFRFDGLNFFEPYAFFLHQKSVDFFLSQSPDHGWIPAAFISGHTEGLRKNHSLDWLRLTGLYHLIVVSGSHVNLLARLTKTWPRFLQRATMIFFVTLNRFDAPAARAVALYFVRDLPLSPMSRSTYAALLCLSLRPQWTWDLGFWMSVAVSAYLETSASIKKAGFLAPVIMLPYTLKFQPCVSWLVLAFQAAAPLVQNYFLVPLSLAGALGFDSLAHGILQLSDGFGQILRRVSAPQLCSKAAPHLTHYWIYGVLLILIMRRLLSTVNREGLQRLANWAALQAKKCR
ncbi:MAG: ComEC/Rec2 family competence protein [Oligoflexia bacterium]|nr:ComEC/Rec2 family competence protein [Oligoflexia bacterium]